MTARDLSFFSSGTRCSATLWPAAADGPIPGVVLCHGFRGIRAWFEPGIAALFSAAGMAVVTFDYRGFGDSDGEPGRLVPSEQVEDIRNALTLLAGQPGVDAGRLALFGTSFGGSNAVAAAAADARVGATVCVVGLGDVGRAWRSAATRLEPVLAADRARRVLTGRSAAIDPADILDNDQSRAAFAAAEQHFPNLRRDFPLEAVERIFEFAPERVAADIAPRALLTIGAESDHAVPTEETRHLYRAAADPKRLEILPIAHYDVYGPPHREHVVDLSLRWFAEHLDAPRLRPSFPATTVTTPEARSAP